MTEEILLPPVRLINLGRAIGERVPFWIQGPGGNISEKVENILWIKASGTRLDRMHESRGVACVEAVGSKRELESILRNKPQLGNRHTEQRYFDLLTKASLYPDKFGRASMETGFHLILPKRLVIHFHSLASILMAYQFRRSPSEIYELAGQDFSIRMIAPTMPGLQLTALVHEAFEADVYLLENHGVILQSESEDILELWKDFEVRFLDRFYGHDVAQILTSSPVELDRWLGSREGPLRFYFPDAAVFAKDLLEQLEAGPNQQWVLKQDKKEVSTDVELGAPNGVKELNLHEIWLAMIILSRLCPDLNELPPEIVSGVAHLPSELFRKSTGNL